LQPLRRVHAIRRAPPYHNIKQGDVVGLLLDPGQRTLSVYLNVVATWWPRVPNAEEWLGGLEANVVKADRVYSEWLCDAEQRQAVQSSRSAQRQP